MIEIHPCKQQHSAQIVSILVAFCFLALVLNLIALESFPIISLCHCCLRNCNIMIYKKIIFGHSRRPKCISHMNLFFVSTVLAHSSPNPCNFMSNKSNGDIFCHEFGLLSSVPEITSELWRWKECLVIHNKPLCTVTGFMLMRWLWKHLKMGTSLSEEPSMREVGIPWFLGMREGWRLNQPSMAKEWTNHTYVMNPP